MNKINKNKEKKNIKKNKLFFLSYNSPPPEFRGILFFFTIYSMSIIITNYYVLLFIIYFLLFILFLFIYFYIKISSSSSKLLSTGAPLPLPLPPPPLPPLSAPGVAPDIKIIIIIKIVIPFSLHLNEILFSKLRFIVIHYYLLTLIKYHTIILFDIYKKKKY